MRRLPLILALALLALTGVVLVTAHRSSSTLPASTVPSPVVPLTGVQDGSRFARPTEDGFNSPFSTPAVAESIPASSPAVPAESGSAERAAVLAMSGAAALNEDKEHASELRFFSDPAIPVSERLAQIETLGRSGDDRAFGILKALAGENTYLNYAAVEALGNFKGRQEVAQYLSGKLADPDSRVLCAAVRGLASVEGAAAVPALAAALKANRSRPDGHHDDVCGACVEALGMIRSEAAVPVLKSEFEETFGVTLLHEYGSKVVKALREIGSPAARPALLAYADRLSEEMEEQSDNPMGKRYLEDKIKEARDAADSVAGGSSSGGS